MSIPREPGDPRVREILDFWFGDDPDDAVVARRKRELWFGKDPGNDRLIAERFGALVERAAAGELSRWQGEPLGLLALLILTDQFTRTVHRGSARAFASDHLARGWCERALARAWQDLLRPIERVFLYLPLEHSERLADQERSVALFSQLAGEVPETQRETFDEYLRYAERHRDIIARFGRFPHRNEILGRQSTPEELEFLTQPGSSF